MWRKFARNSTKIVALLLLFPASSYGQFGASDAGNQPGTVTGIGMVTVKRSPTLIRMTVQLQEKGKTVKDALAKLQDRREAAVLQLQKLGAKKEAIVVGDPSPSAGQSGQGQQMQRMMMQQLRSRGRTPKALQIPKSVTLTATLTSEWPIDEGTNEALLVMAQALKDQVEEADLAGLKEPKQLTPEEEELQEEMAEMMSEYGGYDDNQPKPGVPTFLYVARISDEERKTALASAFQKARDQAQGLAAAAGVRLGGLASLSGNTSQANNDGYGYGNMYAMQMMMAQAAALARQRMKRWCRYRAR